MDQQHIEVENFGPIAKARIDFGSFTVLVGPQATGKSLLLQLWKLVLDKPYLLSYLKRAGVAAGTPEEMLDVYFGEGMRAAWRSDTRIRSSAGDLNQHNLASSRGQKAESGESVFYVPAHRSLLLANNGWPLRFQQLPEVPVVARLFSERLNFALSSGSPALFPRPKKLKQGLRDLVDAAIFHGAKIELDVQTRQRQMRLKYGESTALGFMTWTAGQREFVPLLLGLYELLPGGKQAKSDSIGWVIVEEPEMGLHPKGIQAVTVLLLELAHRGYRVVVSTHAPIVLDVLWAMRSIKSASKARETGLKYVRKVLGVSAGGGMTDLASSILGRDFRVFALQQSAGSGARSMDISALDPNSDEAIQSGWGGLSGISSDIAKAVGECVSASSAG